MKLILFRINLWHTSSPPPPQTPPAEIIRSVAQHAASTCPTLAPDATREQLVINLLQCLSDPKNSIFFFEDSKRLTIEQTPNGTHYYFNNINKGQFSITIPNNEEKISIDAPTFFAEAIIQTVGDRSIDVTPPDGYRCSCKDLSLTPQQLQKLISNFSSLLKSLEKQSQSSSSLPPQTQEPSILALWNASEGSSRSS
jgi:hypothetical protein